MPIVEITFSIPLVSAVAEVADVLLVVLDADHFDHHVGADAVGAEPERQHHVVDVADRRRAQDDPAAPPQVDFAALDLELLQRLVDRRGRQVRVEVAALAVVDGAVGEDQQLGPVADLLHRLVLDPLDRARRRLRLEQRDVDRGGAAAELLPEVLEQVGAGGRGRSAGRSCRRAAPGRGGRRGSPGRRFRPSPCPRRRESIEGRRPNRVRVEKCSSSRSRSSAGLVTTATVSLK